MIRNKATLICSAIILCICMFLYFPFPNNQMVGVFTTVMSFPVRNQDGYIARGIIASVLFIIAMILLIFGMKKYHFRTILGVMILYTLIPNFLITVYQEKLADGIMAISYDGNGECNIEEVSDDLLNGECNINLQNHSNKDVLFELEFLDSHYTDDGERLESIMNLNGPYNIMLHANGAETIQLKELLDVSDVPKHISEGTFNDIHFKITDGNTKRIF